MVLAVFENVFLMMIDCRFLLGLSANLKILQKGSFLRLSPSVKGLNDLTLVTNLLRPVIFPKITFSVAFSVTFVKKINVRHMQFLFLDNYFLCKGYSHLKLAENT